MIQVSEQRFETTFAYLSSYFINFYLFRQTTIVQIIFHHIQIKQNFIYSEKKSTYQTEYIHENIT